MKSTFFKKFLLVNTIVVISCFVITIVLLSFFVGNYITDENIKVLKNDWNANVFRLAMYTDEGGYLSNKDIYNTLVDKADMIIKNDMYPVFWTQAYELNN